MTLFSLDVLQPYQVPDAEGSGIPGSIGWWKSAGVPWGAQMFHVDQKVLCGGRIVSDEHVVALRRLGVTHVLSVDQVDLDGKHWRDPSSRRWIPFPEGPGQLDGSRLYDVGRWVQANMRGLASRKLYVHDKLGGGLAMLLGYFVLRLGGMSRDRAHAQAFRGRVATADELGRLQSGWTEGWLPTVGAEAIGSVERVLGSWVSL